MSECPYCAEPVDAADEKCKSCGEALGRRDPAPEGGGASKSVLIVLGVSALLVLGMCLAGMLLFRRGAQSAATSAMQMRAQLEVVWFQSGCQLYKLDMGSYPQQLSDLWSSPGGTKWQGPYVDSPNPTDPWGNPYVYSLQGSDPTVTSYGADGVAGGSGDAADISTSP